MSRTLPCSGRGAAPRAGMDIDRVGFERAGCPVGASWATVAPGAASMLRRDKADNAKSHGATVTEAGERKFAPVPSRSARYAQNRSPARRPAPRRFGHRRGRIRRSAAARRDAPVARPEVPAGKGTTVGIAPRKAGPRKVDGDRSDWDGQLPGFGGVLMYSHGELVYEDHIFDAYGADNGQDRDRIGRAGPAHRGGSRDSTALDPASSTCPGSSACPPARSTYAMHYGDVAARRRGRPVGAAARHRRRARPLAAGPHDHDDSDDRHGAARAARHAAGRRERTPSRTTAG